MLGSLINMFAQSSTNQDPSSGSKPGKPKGKMEVKLGSGQPFDVSNLISLAAGLLTQGQDKGKDQGINLLNYLPMIMQTISSFTGPEAEKRAEGHSGHSSLLPPYLEKIHIAFDNFIHSDMGKYFLAAIGAEKAFKVFEDDTGRFNYSKFTDMMENLSFRRHWIRMVTDRLVDMLQYASDPKRQKTCTYLPELCNIPDVRPKMLLTQAQFLVNSFLKTQGFPKTAYFDPARPTESLSALVDYLIKKYFEVQIVSKEYVKPLVGYVKVTHSANFREERVGGKR
ncbi:hypothetical protein NQ317_019513 [Molorchus minor]|uniref:Uncharacterized protein n=1 Tax=Molorchus minor TaxID=1323400 RepID=A0ABQ9JXY6_9CUCU|nr:hypothetical protein NQ317_019513 [Molorchus minor]